MIINNGQKQEKCMIVSELLDRIEYKLIKGDTSSEVRGIAFDNRAVKEGDAFVCIKGVLFDTHTVIADIAEKKPSVIIVSDAWASTKMSGELDAIDANIVSVEDTRVAKACVSAAWYGYPSEKMTVIGVTGSKGKTTTAHMIWSIINTAGSDAGFKAGMVGTTGGHIGEDDFHFGTTTPDSDKMQEFLAKMASEGCKYAVVEASSQGLKLHRTDYIDFDYGIFLNIEKGDHISPTEHKDFDEYLDCKRKLLRSSTTCIVNGNDDHIEQMLDGVEGKVITYGTDQTSTPDHMISEINDISEDGEPCVSFKLDDEEYIIGMPGDFNVGNAAASASCALELGISPDTIRTALRTIKVPGRLDMIFRSDRLSVCIDYAHNGLSTRNLLKALRAYGPKRLVIVFGCGGNRDRAKRPIMGEIAGRLSDFVIVTSDNPRNEDPMDIIASIEEGVKRSGTRYTCIENRRNAIEEAIAMAEPDDVILIAGKGHENYQEINGTKYHFDDKEIVEEILKNKAV